NNIVSLSLAMEQTPLDDDVIVIECDLLFDAGVLQLLLQPAPGNIALVDRYRPGMDGTVVAVEDGLITQVFPPHLQGPQFLYDDKYKTLNIYRFDREFCANTFKPLLDCYANLIDGNVFYELVLGMLVNMQRQRIQAAIVDGSKWAEVDDPNDLAAARFQFEPSSRATILDRAMGGHWSFDVTDFAYMRNLRFPTDAMLAAMRQALPAVMRSYGSTQRVLNQKLAWHLLCDASRVQVLHGASQIYPILKRMVGDRPVLRPEPTFGEYARMFPSADTYRDSAGVDLDALERRIPRNGVVVVVTPNSPTGTVIDTGWVFGCAGRHPGATFVVDESFIDFSDQASLIGRLEDRPLPNVLIIKSLSKSFGVPGLRLGYVYSTDAAVIREIDAEIPVWNLGGPAEFFLELMLKYRPDFERSLAATKADRASFAAALEALPIVQQVHPSGGNFLLVTLTGDDPGLGGRIRTQLLEGFAIDVKDVSDRVTPQAPRLRVAVRLPADNARFCDALDAVSLMASA
ncbi:MAG TPA: aminotransferase class I/II-fold pyridoxal phosphate-dependent enzyme, partial [Vicinamibacterales bacterium]|nr:aminotransferase class I/II-fold pyridoxal phosphate-dependent enzyme [Vicinamibacterales bacterium]